MRQLSAIFWCVASRDNMVTGRALLELDNWSLVEAVIKPSHSILILTNCIDILICLRLQICSILLLLECLVRLLVGRFLERSFMGRILLAELVMDLH